MGFAVSARQPSDHAPLKAGREPQTHKDWRDRKLLGLPGHNPKQQDVEAEKSPEGA
jgi:hypothetical protein